MDNNSIQTHAAISPRRTELLADIVIDHQTKQPLGGLNPYNGHFDRIGTQFHHLLIEHANLTPNHRVLDIGCGTGRLAKPLSQFLHNGNYYGFDVHQNFIKYCNDNYQNCQFMHYDIIHDEYNPFGTINPLNFEFPYENHFDIIIAIALFNHFYLDWTLHYLNQITKALKPRGIFFGTFLLLNNTSKINIDKRTKPPYHFSYRTDRSWHDYQTRPLFNTALPEEPIRKALIRNNLMIKEPIRYGDWCGSPIALSGPDVLIAKRGGWAK